MAIYKTQPLDKIFHALGDGTRRDMLAMLTENERLSARELAQPFAIAQPTASKHIKVLEQSALIQRTIEGRVHYFQINTETLGVAESWINRHRQFWAGSLNRIDELVQNLANDEDN